MTRVRAGIVALLALGVVLGLSPNRALAGDPPTPKITSLLAGLLVAAALGGCTGSASGPSTTPTTSSSTRSVSPSETSTSASPSPTASLPSDLPPAARKQTIEGGVEFAKWFVAKGSASFVTLDTAWMASVSGPSCITCTAVAKDVADYKANDWHLSVPRYSFTSHQVQMDATRLAFDVDLLGTEAAASVLDSAGGIVKRFTVEKSWLRITLRWSVDRWRVVEIRTVTL